MQQHHIQLLKDAFRAIGIEEGDVVLVHATYTLFSKQQISPFSIIEGLRAAIGTTGTLLFPTFSDQYVTAENPLFDTYLTKSCMGFLSEYFRLNYATMRSTHPTHSIAGCGQNPHHFLSKHYKDHSPHGVNSPIRILAQEKGKVLLLGTDLMTNPLLHGIEEEVDVPYLFQKERRTIKVLEERQQYLSDYKNYHFKNYRYRYDRLLTLGDEQVIKIGAISGVVSHLLNMERVWGLAKTALQQDPYFFVERV